MSKSVVFDVSNDLVVKVADNMRDKNEDSLLILAPFTGSVSVHAPVKKGKHKGYHRLKLEVWIPGDAIKGEDALSDFGAFALIRLPKSRVQEHLINSTV